MARIRSIHPGLFTDESFMSASPTARLLIIGLWCEAWDDGVFEWKPLTIKARLFPVDAVDTNSLLAELTELRFIQPFTAGDKSFGAIRNFCKFQRPKKPNSSGVLPSSLHSYVAFSEPVPNQYGTGGEKSPQMEDGGWREEGKEEVKEQGVALACANAAPVFEKQGLKARPLSRDWLPTLETVEAAKALGLTDDDVDRGLTRFKNHYCCLTGSGSHRTDWNPALANWLADDAAKRKPKASDGPAKIVPTIWVPEGSDAWAAITKARGKEPVKSHRHGAPGAYVQPHELQSESA